MQVDSDGYATGYARALVMECAERAVQGIKAAQAEHGEGIAVVVRGNSGVSAAFAALMLHKFNLCLLRKSRDDSHGSPLEGPSGFTFRKYLILDDFISSGATVSGMIRDLRRLADAKGEEIPPECVGVVLYNSRTEGYGTDWGYVKNYTRTV